MAVFWCNFRDFVGTQKIEDVTESKIFFAELFQITSKFVLAKIIFEQFQLNALYGNSSLRGRLGASEHCIATKNLANATILQNKIAKYCNTSIPSQNSKVRMQCHAVGYLVFQI